MTDRRPHWVYDAGEEPDPRFTLANERTFLAWVRTALAMLAGAVALHQVGVPSSQLLRTIVVVTLVVLGAVICVLSWVRWALVEKSMRERGPLPSFGLGLWMTIVVVVLALLLAVTLAVTPS